MNVSTQKKGTLIRGRHLAQFRNTFGAENQKHNVKLAYLRLQFMGLSTCPFYPIGIRLGSDGGTMKFTKNHQLPSLNLPPNITSLASMNLKKTWCNNHDESYSAKSPCNVNIYDCIFYICSTINFIKFYRHGQPSIFYMTCSNDIDM